MIKRIYIMLVMVFMCAITAIAATKAEADALYEKENYAEALAEYLKL